MAEKPPEEGYISVVDEEPEIFELLKWDHTQKQQHQQPQQAHHQPTTAYPKQTVTVTEIRLLERPKSPSPEKRKAKEECDPFELPDPTFLETYRLSKDLARNLCEELAPVMPDSTKSIDFSVETKVLAALSFFATGKFQKSIAGKTDPTISMYFVSTAVLQVAEALNNPTVVKKHIHFPHLREERDVIKEKFYMKFGIPNVVGSVDCTHVPIARPDTDVKRHFNKSYHSKKVQIICDSEMNIISVDSYPGGGLSHDTILNQHAVKNDLQSLNSSGEQCWLVGGPYYTQKSYIMTPIPKITKKSPVSPEKYYTTIHGQTHGVITETIKQLKSRFKCLQTTCNKQYDPPTVSKMVLACCILHNICNRRGLPVLQMTSAEDRLETMKQKVANGPITTRKQVEDTQGREIRATLVDRLWNERRVNPEPCAKKRMSKKDRILEVHHHNPNQVHTQQPPPPPPQQPMQSVPMMPHQIHPQPLVMPQPHHHHPMHPDDASKRPRIVMNNPTYGLGVTSGWGHFPQH